MRSTEGQLQLDHVFFKGINDWVHPRLLHSDHSSVVQAVNMRLAADGYYRTIKGDALFYSVGRTASNHIAEGMIVAGTRLVEFFRDISAPAKTEVWIDGTLCGDHIDIPYSNLSMDYDPVDDDIYICSDLFVPTVLNVTDMWTHRLDTKYTTDYDWTLYAMQFPVQMDQPVFVKLVNVGFGGGVLPGSYSYAMRFVDSEGNRSNWGPTTPLIPVPVNSSKFDSNSILTFEGHNSYGGEAVDGNTQYGIALRLRVSNLGGYSYIEIRRIANKSGAAVDYVAIPEYIALTKDINGNLVNIATTTYTVVDFVDRADLQWLVLADELSDSSVAIASARKVRIHESKIVLADITYSSMNVVNNSLFKIDSESKVAQPVKISLSKQGYSDPLVQTYQMSYMCGELYGYAAIFYGGFGGHSFAVPIENGASSLRSYQFPNRRDALTGNALALSIKYGGGSAEIDKLQAAKLSDNSIVHTYESFYQDGAKVSLNAADVVCIAALAGSTYSYKPVTPTGLSGGHGNNARRDDGLRSNVPNDTVDDLSFTLGINTFQPKYCATALAITGINTANLPSWVKGFSIVRTPAAKRIVAQGLAMYKLTQGMDTSSARKTVNQIWLYAPDIDVNIGINPLTFTDIIANPSNYQIELVSSLGFTSRMYQHTRKNSPPNNIYTKVDFASFALFYYDNLLHNCDLDTEIGEGNGYVTFGKWRNTSSVLSTKRLFNINSAVRLHGGEASTGTGRSSFLELTLDSTGNDLYKYTGTGDLGGGQSFQKAVGYPKSANNNYQFHEPWYIVNIIQTGNIVPDNNINTYLDIGHYQKLKSVIGIGNGMSSQGMLLVDERSVDCCSTIMGDRIYILVNEKKWLDVTYETIFVAGWAITLAANGYFTVDSVNYYGMYVHQPSNQTMSIIFPYSINGGTTPVAPGIGEKVEVVYREDIPLIIYGGDVTVGLTSFCPIDCQQSHISDNGASDGLIPTLGENFLIQGPMPVFKYGYPYDTNSPFAANYTIPRQCGNDGFGSRVVSYEQPRTGNILYGDLDYVRQWCVTFICESRVNLPFAFGSSFPSTSYIQRPAIYNAKEAASVTDADFYAFINIFSGYVEDYKDEYLNWGYGGFRVSPKVNFDYSKNLNNVFINIPTAGYTERIHFANRIHWSLSRSGGVINSPSLRTFPAFNYYDIKRQELGRITYLFDSRSVHGNNLGVVVENGICILLTNKIDVTDAIGNSVAIASIESKFVAQEIWLSTDIGYAYDSGITQGMVRMPDGDYQKVIIFPHTTGIKMIVAGVSTKMPSQMVFGELKDITGMYRGELFLKCHQLANIAQIAIINAVDNELWIRLDDATYIYNFELAAWVGKYDFIFDQMVYANKVTNLSTYGVILGQVGNYTYNNQGLYNTFPHRGAYPDRASYVKYYVIAALHNTYDAVDVLLNFNVVPSINLIDKGVINTPTVAMTHFRDFGSGYYSIVPSAGSNRLIHSIFTVKHSTTAGVTSEYLELRSVRIGLKEVVG